MKPTHSLIVEAPDAGTRLDAYLAAALSGVSRSAVKTLIERGLVTVDGENVRVSHKVRAGERVEVEVPPPPKTTLAPEPMDLDVLYEDADVIVVNKRAGMTVHPGAGNRTGTLVSGLLAHAGSLSSIGAPERPGIVHRLDKDTTGSMVAAKTDRAHVSLAAQFKEHSTRRTYRALVWGTFKKKTGTIDIPLGRDRADRKKISTKTRKSRHATTDYRVVRSYGLLSLVELSPRTGRTHQLRVHLSAIGHPIACDPVYCKRKIPPALDKEVADALKGIKHQLLHAATLGFTHPATGEDMDFSAPLPDDFSTVVGLLEKVYAGGPGGAAAKL